MWKNAEFLITRDIKHGETVNDDLHESNTKAGFVLSASVNLFNECLIDIIYDLKFHQWIASALHMQYQTQSQLKALPPSLPARTQGNNPSLSKNYNYIIIH